MNSDSRTPKSFLKTLPLLLNADLVLPAACSICGKSLSLNRRSCNTPASLCLSCRIKADSEIFGIKYPVIRRCIKCGYPLTSEFELCGRCRGKSWNFESSTSLFIYQGIGKELITAYKFDNCRGLSTYFRSKIIEYHKDYHPDTTIIPVPFRPSSKRKRGWDHIEEIVDKIPKQNEVTVLKCLKRKNGSPQKIMDYSRRLQNLDGKIFIKNNQPTAKKVLLVDDVFTTGATLDYCAGILKKAGTESIFCITIALDL
jgi:ComF family protein